MDGVVTRTVGGMMLIVALAGTTALWPWGICTLLWVAYTIWFGTTYIVEPVERAKHPRLYWVVIIFWTLSGLAMVAVDSL